MVFEIDFNQIYLYLPLIWIYCHRVSIKMYINKMLQVAQTAECARAAELRAQVAKHAALEEAARKDARAQCHKLVRILKLPLFGIYFEKERFFWKL